MLNFVYILKEIRFVLTTQVKQGSAIRSKWDHLERILFGAWQKGHFLSVEQSCMQQETDPSYTISKSILQLYRGLDNNVLMQQNTC